MNAIFSSFLQMANDLKDKVKKNGQQLLQRGNLERCAKVVALVAYWPDKDASQAEIRKGILAIQNLVGKEVFDPREMEKLVLENIQTLKDLEDMGKAKLLGEVAGVISKDTAGMLVGAAILVAKADGAGGAGGGDANFSDEEKKIVREIAEKLKLNPADFGL